jgi:hypothetical protein
LVIRIPLWVHGLSGKTPGNTVAPHWEIV